MSVVHHILDLLHQAELDYDALCAVDARINQVLAEEDLAQEAKNALLEIKNDVMDNLTEAVEVAAEQQINDQAAAGNLDQLIQDPVNEDNPAAGG